MTNQRLMIPTSSTSPPPAADGRLAHLLAVMHSRLIGKELVGEIPDGQRLALVKRQELLASHFVPAPNDEIKKCVAGMMVSFFTMRGVSRDEALRAVQKYADDLAGIPLWAVSQTCRDASRGRIEELNPDMPPSAARLRRHAEQLIAPFAVEHWQLKHVLEAHVVPEASEEEKQRVGEAMAAFGKSLRTSDQINRLADADVRQDSRLRYSGYAQRVMAEIAARKAAREEGNEDHRRSACGND